MHGAHGDGELIDGVGVDLGEGDGHGVVTGLDDSGNAGNVGTNGNTGGGVSVDVLGDQLRQGRTGGLGLHSGETPVVLLADSQEEVLGGGIGSQTIEAPAGSSGGNIGSTVGQHSVNDLLGKLHAAVVDSIPEGLLLLFGEVGVVGVVLTGLSNQLGQGGHGVAVLLQTHDGGGVHGYRAVIRRIKENIHREDDVVDGDRLAVRELQVVAQLDVIGDGAVVILGDNAVRGAVVGVVGAVVLAGLTLDAVQDHLALTVSAEQA